MPVAERIELADRVTLSLVRQGDAGGVPMLLLHGVTDSWRSFEPVLPHLPGSIHAIAVSQRGHGDSDRPHSGYRTADYAADVSAFLDAAGIERAVVVGHSMGATNAQRLAIDRPERVRGLVLAGSFASYRDNPMVTEFWDSAVSRLEDPIDPAFVRGFQESTLARPVGSVAADLVAFVHTLAG